MSDTTVDPGTTTVQDPTTLDPAPTTVIDPLPTTAVDPGTTFVDPGTVAPAPAPTTPVNEAIPTSVVATPVTLTSAPIFPSNISSPSTLLTSTRPSQTSSDSGSPFNGPPPFVTGGSGRPPFASGSGPPFFNDDDRAGLSAGAKAGIGVGVVALVFSIVAVVLLIWRMKKKERGQVWGGPEPLPPYTESTTSVPSATGGAAATPAMEMKPKSAMKKTSPAPLLLNLRGGEGSDSPVPAGSSTERRRSYAMEGSEAPLVLSIWEPANRSSSSLGNNSPIMAPAPPPKVHRKSNTGSRPRRKSNLAPVSEEEAESSGARLGSLRDDDSSSRPGTPRTPRSAAFHALTGDDHSGHPSPMSASFSLEPVPPLPGGNVSPVSSKFSDKGK